MRIAVIADDFTGASDAASFLVAGGLETILYDTTPHSSIQASNAEAVVIALKTRTMELAQALELSQEAYEYLTSLNPDIIYFKYCSTFDSTPEGNIGPVADMLLELTGSPYTVLCPALPVNGRQVKNGHLYVNGAPLHESPMRDHPLTPMWDSSIPNLMKDQSKLGVYPISQETLALPKRRLQDYIHSLDPSGKPFYLVPDYEDDSDAQAIVNAFKDFPFLTGGSGLLEPLARRSTSDHTHSWAKLGGTDGRAIIIVGSASAQTRKQVREYLDVGHNGLMLDPDMIRGNAQLIEETKACIHEAASAIMIYSSGSLDQSPIQRSETNAKLLEDTFAELATFAKQEGYKRFIVAGGETSGAVVQALQLNAYRIGESIAPGVPLLQPISSGDLRLVLKSGNYGQDDFFQQALTFTKIGMQSSETSRSS